VEWKEQQQQQQQECGQQRDEQGQQKQQSLHATEAQRRVPGRTEHGARQQEDIQEPHAVGQEIPGSVAPVLASDPSGPQQQGACAVCGRTARDGAKLRRCAGCGSVTGTRYCSQECCRTDWVVRGHRAVCKAARHGGGSSGGQPEGVGA
jgi:hypothetical protein